MACNCAERVPLEARAIAHAALPGSVSGESIELQQRLLIPPPIGQPRHRLTADLIALHAGEDVKRQAHADSAHDLELERIACLRQDQPSFSYRGVRLGCEKEANAGLLKERELVLLCLWIQPFQGPRLRIDGDDGCVLDRDLDPDRRRPRFWERQPVAADEPQPRVVELDTHPVEIASPRAEIERTEPAFEHVAQRIAELCDIARLFLRDLTQNAEERIERRGQELARPQHGALDRIPQ